MDSVFAVHAVNGRKKLFLWKIKIGIWIGLVDRHSFQGPVKFRIAVSSLRRLNSNSGPVVPKHQSPVTTTDATAIRVSIFERITEFTNVTHLQGTIKAGKITEAVDVSTAAERQMAPRRKWRRAMIKGFAKEGAVLINRELLQGSFGSCEVGATLFSVLAARKAELRYWNSDFFSPTSSPTPSDPHQTPFRVIRWARGISFPLSFDDKFRRGLGQRFN